MENPEVDSSKNPLKHCEEIDVFFFKNGERELPPRKYHFSQNDLNYWNDTLKSVASTEIEIGNNLELYNLNGQKIQGPLELRDGAAYVIVKSDESFKDTGYESYLVQASRSMEKRLKQSNKYEHSTVPTLNNVTGRKTKKRKKNTNLENLQEKKTVLRSKSPNMTQISNVSNIRTWPGKRKEDDNSQKQKSPIRRRTSPIRKGKLEKRDSSTVDTNRRRSSSREMVALNSKEKTPEGIKGYNNMKDGRLSNVFREMKINNSLENGQDPKLIRLNEKTVVTKDDAAVQVVVVQIDEGTEPPIVVEYDEKGVQKPSNSSITRNYENDNYVAVMEADATLQLTIQASVHGEGITTLVSDKNNAEMIKLENNLYSDSTAQLRIDTSLANKMIIDTKVVKVVVIHCTVGAMDNANVVPLSATKSDNHNRQSVVREKSDIDSIVLPKLIRSHSCANEQEAEIRKSSKNTITSQNYSDTAVNDDSETDFGIKKQRENRINSVPSSLLVKSPNEMDSSLISRTRITQDASMPFKRQKKVSLSDEQPTEFNDPRISVDADGEPIILLEPGAKNMDQYRSKKFSLTERNLPADNESSQINLPKSHTKSLNLHLSSKQCPEKLPGSLSSNKETSTSYQSEAPCSTTRCPSAVSKLSTLVEKQCKICYYKPPPCVPNCTPLADVSPSASQLDPEKCNWPEDLRGRYIQTDSCEVLLMVRRHPDDSQYSFHFPTIRDLKDFKLI